MSGAIEAPSESRIGHIVRVNYRFQERNDRAASGSSAWRAGRQAGKARPCAVVGHVGDYYVVAPISSKPSGNDIALSPGHTSAAKLRPNDGSFIEIGEYNLVHRDSGQFSFHENSRDYFRGILPPGPVAKLRADFLEKFKARTLKSNVSAADPALVAARARSEVRVAASAEAPKRDADPAERETADSTAAVRPTATSLQDRIRSRAAAAHAKGAEIPDPSAASPGRRPTLTLSRPVPAADRQRPGRDRD